MILKTNGQQFEFAEKLPQPRNVIYGDVNRDALIDNYGYLSLPVNYNDFFSGVSGATTQEYIQKMESEDPHILINWGVVESILGYPREIDGDGEMADFVREQFSNIPDFNNLLSRILSAIKVGFCPVEIQWSESSSSTRTFKRYGLRNIIDWSASQFIFGKKEPMELRILKPGEMDGVPVNEATQFKVATYRPKYGNRYGTGLYHVLWWPFYFTTNAVKFWSIAVERFAAPIPIFSSDGKMDHDTSTACETFIKNMKSNEGLILENKVKFEVLTAYKEAGENFDAFIKYFNIQKALVLTGSTDHIEGESGGSLARSQVKAKLRMDVCGQYIDFLEGFINDHIIKTLIDVNFSNVNPVDMPKWRIKVPETAENLNEFIQAMAIAAKGGVEIPNSFIMKKMGIPTAGKDEPLFTPQEAEKPPVETAESNFAYKHYEEARKAYYKDLEAIGGVTH